MVNLIILGIIPGTKSQLSFYGIVLGLLLIGSGTFLVYSVYFYIMSKKRAFIHEDYNKPGFYNLISI